MSAVCLSFARARESATVGVDVFAVLSEVELIIVILQIPLMLAKLWLEQSVT